MWRAMEDSGRLAEISMSVGGSLQQGSGQYHMTTTVTMTYSVEEMNSTRNAHNRVQVRTALEFRSKLRS